MTDPEPDEEFLDDEELDAEDLPDEGGPDEGGPDEGGLDDGGPDEGGPDRSEKPAPPSDEERGVKGPPAATNPDLEIDHPDTPIPERVVLLEALKTAFAGEEDVPDALLESYADHALRVLEGNRRMNLTAILDPLEVAIKHYLDSWRATRLLPLMGRSVLDLGCGAGFPGIPIALAEPNTRVVCCDSTKKRADFVQECVDAMEIKNASAVWERAEEYLARNKFDIVIVRGVSSIRENVRLLRKVRHSHKDLVMLKGPSWSREARAGEREVERLGFRLDTVWEHELPEEMGGRAILVFRAPGGMGE